MRATLQSIVGILDQIGQRCVQLQLGDGMHVLITQYGGRVLGPFFADDEECMLWLSPAFGCADELTESIARKEWNIGGDRIWIAPELHYNVHDRKRFHETYDLQADLDPGRYLIVDSGKSCCTLAQDMHLKIYNLPQRDKYLRLERTIVPVADPLRDVSVRDAFTSRLRFAGYAQEVALSDYSPDELLSQTWNITQVPSGGVVMAPTSPALEYADYWQPIDREHLTVSQNHIQVLTTGDSMFKLELKAAHHYGRSGYFRKMRDGRAWLMIKLFFNDPSEPYVVEAPHLPGIRGYSFDIYKDDGKLGDFTELECHGRPIGGSTGRTRSMDRFVNWFYVGEEGTVKSAAEHLLGFVPNLGAE